MREIRTSGSVGAPRGNPGGDPVGATLPSRLAHPAPTDLVGLRQPSSRLAGQITESTLLRTRSGQKPAALSAAAISSSSAS